MKVLGAVAIMVLGGLGLFGWLHPRRATDRFEAIGVSLLLGSVLVSLLVFAFGNFLRGSALVAAVAGCAVALGLSGCSRLRRVTWESLPQSKWYGVLLAVGGAVVAWQALVQPLGADGVVNFEVRARLGWQAGGAIPAEFFSDRSREHMHASYPLFVPLNQLWIYLCAQQPHQGLIKLLGAFWFVAAASLTFSQLSRATRSPWPGFLAYGLMFAIPMMVFYTGGAVWAWGDYPVGVMAVAALLYLREMRASGHGFALFVVLVAALPWIKREGLILGTALLLGLAMAPDWRRQWAIRLGAAIPFLLSVIGWKLFTAVMDTPIVGDFHTPSPGLLAANFDRAPRIAVITLREFAVWQRWALLWPLALFAWVRILREPALATWRFAVLTNVGLIATYASVYLFSTWPSLPWHMLTSFPRLLLAPAMMASVLVAVAVPLSARKTMVTPEAEFPQES